MRILMTGTNLSLTPGIREHLMQRISRALDRVESRIQQVRVRVSDINGPHGGPDKRCQLEVISPRLPTVVLDEVAEDLYVAIDRAVSRLKTVVLRKLARPR